jgi:hypothetical protein
LPPEIGVADVVGVEEVFRVDVDMVDVLTVEVLRVDVDKVEVFWAVVEVEEAAPVIILAPQIPEFEVLGVPAEFFIQHAPALLEL